MSRFINKGTIGGVATILAGVAAVIESVGLTPHGALLSLITFLGGIVTVKDSIDMR